MPLRKCPYFLCNHTFIGLLFGFVIGVTLSTAVVWYIYKTPLPASKQKTESTDNKKPLFSGKPGTVIKLQGKPGKPQNSTPTIAKEPPPNANEAADTSSDTSSGGKKLFLEVGSFPKINAADRIKAKLSLHSFANVKIQEIEQQGKLVYQVHVGPFTSRTKMNRARNTLSQIGIHSSPIIRGED